MGTREETSKGVKAPAASAKGDGSPACDRVPVKARKRGHACKVSPCTEWRDDSKEGPSATARGQFARTFADVLAGRFGGSWSVAWEGTDRSALSTNRDRRAFSREK